MTTTSSSMAAQASDSLGSRRLRHPSHAPASVAAAMTATPAGAAAVRSNAFSYSEKSGIAGRALAARPFGSSHSSWRPRAVMSRMEYAPPSCSVPRPKVE